MGGGGGGEEAMFCEFINICDAFVFTCVVKQTEQCRNLYKMFCEITCIAENTSLLFHSYETHNSQCQI